VNWLSADLWRGRRVVVTGGSGFLGGWICKILVDAGAEVHSVGHKHRPRWGSVFHQASFPDHATRLLDDVQPERVFHLAGPVNPGATTDLHTELRSGIVDATTAMIEAAQRVNAQLIHAGTCAEYGDCEAPYSESQTPQPHSLYGALKWEATQHVLASGGTVVRPFRAIGPGDHKSVVAAAAIAALNKEAFEMTEGSQVREWNHAQAIAQGIIAAAVHREAQGQVINIGGGETRSVYGVVETLFRLAGSPKDLIKRGARKQRSGEVPLLAGHHQSAQAIWGSVPQPSLDDTLKQSLLWIQKAHGDAT